MDLSGVRWRWRGVRQHVRLAARHAGRPATALQLLARAPRRPSVNARWRLQRFGREVLQATLEAARRCDVEVFVTFGTLLGWHRDGGFIIHDDDVDLGVLDDAWPGVADLAAAMATEGWRVRWFADDEVRFTHPRHEVAIDIFRFRDAGGQFESRAYSDGGTTLHQYRFDKHLIIPLRQTDVFGLSALVPAEVEGLLTAHYGDWQTPSADWDYRTDAASSQKP